MFFLLGGTLLAVLLLVTVINLLITERVYAHSIHEQLDLVGNGTEAVAEERLLAIKNNILAISEDTSLKKYANSYAESVLDYHLNRYRSVVPLIGYADWRGVTHKELVNGHVLDVFDDFKADPLYKRVLAKPNEVLFSPIAYEDALNGYAIRFAVLRQGYFGEQSYGIIFGAISLEKLLVYSATAKQIVLRIINEHGILQYSSRNEKCGEKLLTAPLREDVSTMVISGAKAFTWVHRFLQGRSMLVVGYGYEEAMSGTYEMIGLELLIFFIALLVTLFFSRHYLSQYVLVPIGELIEGTKSIVHGDYTRTITVRTGDEIENLANSFNHMMQKLDTSAKELSRQQAQLLLSNQKLDELNTQLEKRVADKIKELRERDHLLIQQSRLAAMGEMISNIAHQWRQPLNTLGLILQNIKRAHAREKLGEKELDVSYTKGMKLIRHMSDTIDSFRDFFRPQKEKKVFFVSEDIAAVLDLVGSAMEHANIRVDLDIKQDSKVLGFANEFSQVMLNLLQNAKDAVQEKGIPVGRVEIVLDRKEYRAEVCIQDNAGGISEEIIHKIFEPYFTTKGEGKGTGIGLYMSKMIIEQNMGGTIRVENRGEGACFIISLPLEGEASTSPATKTTLS